MQGDDSVHGSEPVQNPVYMCGFPALHTILACLLIKADQDWK